MTNKPLYLFNTQSGGKEVFTAGPEVRLYVCGVTPYDYAHLGHARCYVAFDVLIRVLEWWGYKVRYIQNVTDVDDKIVRKAQQELGDGGDLAAAAGAIARRFTREFNHDMRTLNVCSPSAQPTISENMQAIIAFIAVLIDRGHAYESGSDVYFSIDSWPAYGHLSGRSLEDLVAGARIEPNEHKKNPADFALWKGGVAGSFWQSPWGLGRPGWHIECSALARAYAGETLDIHAGGIDLLFPHHENECAQSEALTGKPLARFWLHNAHVTLASEKMSKSLGNTRTIRDVCAHYDPMVLRFYLLQHHYRSPLDLNMELLAGSAKAYARLARALNPEEVFPKSEEQGLALCATLAQRWPLFAGLLDAIADDLNVAKALGLLFAELPAVAADPEAQRAARAFVVDVCGLWLMPIAEKEPVAVSAEIAALLEARDQARAARDWQRADELRDELKQRGYVPVDTKVAREKK